MASLACRLRAPYAPPAHADGGLGAGASASMRIQFCHPGYPDTSDANIMLLLPALDTAYIDGQDMVRFGVHHETARIACAIIANCAWDGFLSVDKHRGASPIVVDSDGLLTATRYYFHVPAVARSSDEQEDSNDLLPWRYPVVPSFAHFRFPHRNLPPYWTREEVALPEARNRLARWTDVADLVAARDVSCRITEHTLGTEAAHLVQRSDEAWFRDNVMMEYNMRPAAATDDQRNLLLLRSDLHRLFDMRKFVMVPKGSAWVAHVLEGRPSEELAALYHNVELQPLVDLSIECLFARFAWAILAQGLMVRTGAAERRLVVLESKDKTAVVKDVSAKQCRLLFEPQLPGSIKSRSQSPQKRPREEDDDLAVDNEDDGYDDSDYLLINPDDDDIWSRRGRPRKRLRNSLLPSEYSEPGWDEDTTATAADEDDGNEMDKKGVGPSACAGEGQVIPADGTDR